MGSLRHPVGEQPPQVYWFRRVLVLVVAIAVIVGLWWLLSTIFGGDSAESGGEGSTPAESSSPGASNSAEAATVSDDPSRACTANDVTITTTASPASPTIGTMPAFDLSIQHVGTSPCTLSTDTEGTELAVSSGNDQYYSTSWCPEDPGFESKTWVLQADDVQALQVVWPGIWQNSDCTGPVNEIRPGTYQAAVSVAGIPSEVATFTMVE
ncbi:hypothetical protein [Demequina sediminicola]|uniref:hypothetical protein n=1 Tax=Demequina sediminicola TaxID=1095026 RepID=UPI000785DC06|nr:hypothetical protein [Demequina sediminicola]